MEKQQLLKNSVVGVIQLLFTSILTLISIPIFIKNLGITMYGIFAVLSVIGNLNILTNFGLNGALLVHIAKQGKCRESDHDIIVTHIIMICIVVIFSLLTILFKRFIIYHILSISNQYYEQSEKLLTYLVLSTAILLLGQTYTAILDGIERIYVTNICQFLYSLVYWIGMITVVTLGGNLSDVGQVAFIAALLWLMLVMVNCYRFWGKLTISGLKAEFFRAAKKQLSFGIKIYISGLAGFLFEPLSKILLSNFVGLNAVAYFEIGAKVKNQINSFLTKALYPIYPFIAKTKESPHLHKKLSDFARTIQLLVLPISLIVIFSMPSLLNLWLGSQYTVEVKLYVIVMTVSLLLFSSPVYIIYQYMTAKKMVDHNIWVQLLSAFVNIVIFLISYKGFRVYSILLSNTCALFASFLLLNFYQFKFWGYKIKSFIFFYNKMFWYVVVSSLSCLVIFHLLPSSPWDILIYPIIISFSFIYFVRIFELICVQDIVDYFGTIPPLKNILIKIFIE